VKTERLLDTLRNLLEHLDGGSPPGGVLPRSDTLTPEETFPVKDELRHLLCRLLTHRKRFYALYLMLRFGILDAILPEVKALYGVPQPPEFHPEGEVFRHTALTLHFLKEPTCGVAFAALLHDVGKPSTFAVKERIRFDSHNIEALPIIEKVAERLHLDSSTKEVCLFVAKEHMRLLDARKMRPGRLKNFLSHPLFPQLLEVWFADIAASHGDLGDYKFILAKYEESRVELERPPLLLSGTDLIKEGYKPGPLFKRMLSAVEEAQKSGIISTYEDAIRFIRDRFKV